MEIHNFPPPGEFESVRSSKKDGQTAMIGASKSCDRLINSITAFQKGLDSQVHEGKYHKLLTQMLQGYDRLKENLQHLAAIDPSYTANLAAVREVYQSYVQPMIVKERPSIGEEDHIIDRLETSKEHFTRIISELSNS